MRIFIYLSFFMTTAINAQTLFKNFGDIQMHSNAKIGFHTDVINDGKFDENLGFAGFYSDSGIRTVSGLNRPIFYNVEIDAVDDLELKTSLGVTNELEYINGKVITPRNDINISLDFIRHNFYVGEDNDRHTDGYSSVTSNLEFVFPIGDDDRLRPMIIPNQNIESYFNGAYFFENPNSTVTFFNNMNFDTSLKQVFLDNISQHEYWDLDGETETKVTLTWDFESNIQSISDNLNTLRVVGWNKLEGKWFDLGGNEINGNFTSGRLTSDSFTPNEYEIITIGSISNGEIDNVNILISPNDDNKNDFLVFEGLELFNKNKLSVFNRWGNSVLEVENYTNNWNAISQGRATIEKDRKLPVGTYFYILNFGNDNLDKKISGWIYINR